MMRFSYKIFLFAALFLFNSCERLEISHNQRLLVKGKIIAEGGEPIPNISVKTEALNSTLANTRTDADGNFKFTSLNVNESSLYVLINKEFKLSLENENTDYASKIFTSETDNEQLLIDLGTVKLGPVGTFSLQLINLPGDENFMEYTLSYSSKVCYLPIGFNSTDSCQFDQTIRGELDQSSQNRSFTEESILGTVAVFEYKLNNGPSQTIEIPVTYPPTNYVFEY